MRTKLKKLREQRGLLQKDIAGSIGITTSYYGMIELGTRQPSIVVAHKLSDFFEVSIEEIFFAHKNNNWLSGEKRNNK